MTRPNTPPTITEKPDGGKTTRMTVKRCCENCGRELGDATPDELEAAVAGAPLSSVKDECGCSAVVEQLAQFANGFDHHEYGTAKWGDLDEVGREAYRTEATRTLRAIVHLGWAPKEQS
jgi:hypothetical protein